MDLLRLEGSVVAVAMQAALAAAQVDREARQQTGIPEAILVQVAKVQSLD